MKTIITVGLLSVAVAGGGSCQLARSDEDAAMGVKRSLKQMVPHFEVKAASFTDGVSHLTSMSVATLHLGFEEVFRSRISDPDQGILFSLILENSAIGDILDALCKSDSRYMWSIDGTSINIYPRATVGDKRYLPNLWLERISVAAASDPDAFFGPLDRLLPNEQLGLAHLGPGDTGYPEPWTVAFVHLTVRQLVNRAAKHMGPRSSWILDGTAQERFFTFEKGAFYTKHELERK